MKFRFSRPAHEGRDIFFSDELLSLGYAERFFVRVLTNSWIIVQAIVTFIFLLSEVRWAFWLGIFSSLYLADWLVYYSKPEENLQSLDKFGNVALCLSPRARRAIVSAYNKATVLGGGFYLNLARELSETSQISEMLSRLGVDAKEFNSKLDAYLTKDLVSYRDRDRLMREIERVVFAALEHKDEDEKYIDSPSLFAALGGLENEQVDSLFRVFEISESALFGVVPFGRTYGRPSGLWTARLGPGLRVPERDLLAYRIRLIEKRHKVKIPLTSIETSTNGQSGMARFGSTEAVLEKAAAYVSGRGDDIVRSEDVLNVIRGGEAPRQDI